MKNKQGFRLIALTLLIMIFVTSTREIFIDATSVQASVTTPIAEFRDVLASELGNPALSDVGARFRAVHNYAVANGYVGGFPTMHYADYGQGRVFGVILLRSAAAEVRDVLASTLGNPPLNDLAARSRAAHDYAVASGYVGGFPTMHYADYAQGRVYGVILIKQGAGEFRDVLATELGTPALSDIGARYRAVDSYASSRGYVSGFPTMHYANYGQGRVDGTILIRSVTVVDTVAPNGYLTQPAEGTRFGPGQVSLAAVASDNAGGTGVQSTKFKVIYNGQWRTIGSDTTAPYGLNWTTPTGLRSQQIRFAIDITDHAGNVAINAGGQRTVNFIESQSNPGVVENWIPESKRAYLNQRSLSPSGDSKCGSAGAAMMLAMNGLIGKDYNSLRDTANAIYPKTIKNGDIWLYLITAQIRARGLNAQESNQNADTAWATIKTEINAGYPVMLLSRKVTAGHFFVVVGYREEGTSRRIIVYDPYGNWLGSYRSYDRNTTNANSAKGRWVTYDYNASWGGGWIVTARPYAQAMTVSNLALDENNPDPISEEALDEFTYEGILVNEGQFIFLPLIVRGD